MSTRSRNIPDQLLFFDALSGEFRPASDLGGRPHTVGRLALETIERGEVIRTGFKDIDTGKTYGFEHRP